jgi:hypothetical protein
MGSSDPTHPSHPRGSPREIRQRLALQEKYATAFLVLMFAQVAVTNGVFFLFGWSRSWVISDAALLGYIGATLGEIVAIVIVIVRYLFAGAPSPP